MSNLLNFTYIIIAFSISLSQFYFIGSGNAQITHYTLIIFLGFIFFTKIKDKIDHDKKIIILMAALASYFIMINSFYAIINYENSHQKYYINFFLSNLHILFNLFIFYSLSLVVKDKNFRIIFFLAILFGFCLLMSFYFLGIGQSYQNVRFLGFFNDPNQMAYYALCLTVSALIISFNNYSKLLIMLIGIYIVVLSGSRSGFLAAVILLLGIFFDINYNLYKKISLNYFIPLFVLFNFIIISIFFLFILFNSEDIFFLFNRLLTTNFDKELEVRGIMHFIEYPYYFIFGSGSGLFYRFSQTGHEIHSTCFNILFSYGLIGFILFIYFLYECIKKANFYNQIYIGSIFVYGFFTYGARNPFFWICLAIIYSIPKINYENKK